MSPITQLFEAGTIVAWNLNSPTKFDEGHRSQLRARGDRSGLRAELGRSHSLAEKGRDRQEEWQSDNRGHLDEQSRALS
jgi:hypothetical protein